MVLRQNYATGPTKGKNELIDVSSPEVRIELGGAVVGLVARLVAPPAVADLGKGAFSTRRPRPQEPVGRRRRRTTFDRRRVLKRSVNLIAFLFNFCVSIDLTAGWGILDKKPKQVTSKATQAWELKRLFQTVNFGPFLSKCYESYNCCTLCCHQPTIKRPLPIV